MAGAKVKGWIKNQDTGAIMSFQYNPESFDHSRAATYVEIVAPGMQYPLTQFVRGNAREFSVELFLHDIPFSGVIPNYLSFLESFLPPEINVDGYTKPPELLFCYGTFVKNCVLEELGQDDEMYDDYLRPLQTRFSLKLRQVGV